MARQKIVGYVVCCEYGGLYKLIQNTLWFGNCGTIFSTRKSAKNAIERTKKHVAKEGLDWPWLEETDIVVLKNEF